MKRMFCTREEMSCPRRVDDGIWLACIEKCWNSKLGRSREFIGAVLYDSVWMVTNGDHFLDVCVEYFVYFRAILHPTATTTRLPYHPLFACVYSIAIVQRKPKGLTPGTCSTGIV